MKSDFLFVLIALGTLVRVTCAFPASSEIQQDDHAFIAEDLLTLLNKAADSQNDYGHDNTESAEAQVFRNAARKVKGFAGRLRGRGPTYPGGAVPAPEFIYIPGGSPAQPGGGQGGYSRGGTPGRGGGGDTVYRPRTRLRGRTPANLGEGVPAPEFTYIPGASQEYPGGRQQHSYYGGGQAIGNEYKVLSSKSQPYGDNSMQAEAQLVGAIVGGTVSLLAPYAVDVVHKVGQFTGRAIKGVKNFVFNRGNGDENTGQYPTDADPRYPEGIPQYPQGPPGYPDDGAPGYPPPQYGDPSSNSNEEKLLESELLQVANEQQKVVPFRRESFIKNPDKWKLKPNYKRGFFESIKQFFKDLYQMANV